MNEERSPGDGCFRSVPGVRWPPIWRPAEGTEAGRPTTGSPSRRGRTTTSPSSWNEMRRTKDITVKVSFADDNLTNFQQLKRGVDYDVVTADALWVPRFLEDGLIEPFDPAEPRPGATCTRPPAGSVLEGGSLTTRAIRTPGRRAAPLLQPEGGPHEAGLVARAARHEVPGQDRAREQPERHDGQRRPRDRRGQAVRDDQRRDLAGQGLPQVD